MADPVTVTVTFSDLKDRLEKGLKPIDGSTARKVGNDVVNEMKKLISNGTSPIEGNGKFQAYKNPAKYPGGKKSSSPVNLTLTGKFLAALTYSVESGDGGSTTKIFFKGDEQEAKERGHREGANRQPKRPSIPSGGNEKFVKVIREIYTKLYQERILDVLRGKG